MPFNKTQFVVVQTWISHWLGLLVHAHSQCCMSCLSHLSGKLLFTIRLITCEMYAANDDKKLLNVGCDCSTFFPIFL
jgi:hypothetical protein